MSHDNAKKDLSDALFIQLCSMVRDMNVKVRVEAFNAIGNLGLVSEDVLLQTLSKKVLHVMREKTYPQLCAVKPVKILASSAAGAFVHGLEDEFCEVRRSACHSLHTLSVLSADFACEASNILVEVLNDDSMVVRLQALETMHCMALFNHLKLQQIHMHMFLSTLVDPNASVRTAARKVLRVAKLNQMAIFRICIDGLLENLEMYPQDEADILSILSNIGRSHGTFAVKIIEGVLHEIDPPTDGKLGFDSSRMAALLVLAVSAPLLHEQHRCFLPPRIFSYAVTMLGRISRALSNIMDQGSVLAYLSHCSRSDIFSPADFQFSKRGPPVSVQGSTPNNAESEVSKELVTYQLEDCSDILSFLELICEKVQDIWQLIQHGCISEVLNILRNWKEELATFPASSSSDALAFMTIFGGCQTAGNDVASLSPSKKSLLLSKW